MCKSHDLIFSFAFSTRLWKTCGLLQKIRLNFRPPYRAKYPRGKSIYFLAYNSCKRSLPQAGEGGPHGVLKWCEASFGVLGLRWMRMLSESKLTFYRKIVYAEGILIRHLLCPWLRKRHLLLLREGFTQKNFHQKSKCCYPALKCVFF